MLIIGETLNAVIPKVGQAVVARDAEAITVLARCQVECGAQMLDMNAGGLAGRDEVEDLVWMIRVVQEAVEIPLVLDSANPEALHAAMNIYRGPRPILSSATAEPKYLERLLPLAVEHDCRLVALCMGERGIPPDPEGRLAVAETLVKRATMAGLKPEDLYLDPLVMTISADHRAGDAALATLCLIRERLPEVHTICGVSNVGFGLPQRRLLNRTFVAMLMALGLEAFMVDVRDQALMATLLAAAALTGRDEWCSAYLKAYRAGKLDGK
jgi:5-methyltetrahydrofolate corrinoid/iron sulfur protein methyltransferase